MPVIPFPRAERREERLRGIEQCLESLHGEAQDMGFELLAHIIAVAREAAHDSAEDVGLSA